jgi:hypothetical protein
MPRIDHAEVVTEGIEVIIQHINTLLNKIFPILNLLILLLRRQRTKLCSESINVTMQPLLNILKTSHDGLVHGGVKMLPKLLKTGVHVTLPLLPHGVKALLHLLLNTLTKLSKRCVLCVLHVLKVGVNVTWRRYPSMLLRPWLHLWLIWIIIHVLIMISNCSFLISLN